MSLSLFRTKSMAAITANLHESEGVHGLKRTLGSLDLVMLGIGAGFAVVCAAMVGLALTLAVGRAVGGAADESRRPGAATVTRFEADPDTPRRMPPADPPLGLVLRPEKEK